MTWVKLDDGLHRHRKARIAGLEAMGLWTMAASWVGDELTDGFVPRSVLYGWSPVAHELAERLEVAGLWIPTVHLGEEGWLFHDWADYNPTKEQVLTRRDAEREKKRRQRASPAGTTEGTPSGTPAGRPAGSPGTGNSSYRNLPYPDSRGESPSVSPRDKSHTFEPDSHGDCQHCPMPSRHPVHRTLHVVEEAS